MSANWSTNRGNGSILSLDAWALIFAFVVALAVKFNIWQNIPW